MKKSFFSFLLVLGVAFASLAQDHGTNPEKYYLYVKDVANSEKLLPPPPTENSKRFAYDREQWEWGKSLRDTPRGKQAIVDADLSDGWLDRSFSEAFGMPLTKENAPEIYKLMNNMKEDAGDLATRACKNHYMRPRPFVVFNEPTATPWDEPALRKNGSYPSGHTSIGWATALVLAEINPARVNEIIKRGFEFGQSRVIVGAHYQSDVDMGRVVGAACVSSLHQNKDFQKQLKKAKKEFAKLSKRAKK